MKICAEKCMIKIKGVDLWQLGNLKEKLLEGLD